MGRCYHVYRLSYRHSWPLVCNPMQYKAVRNLVSRYRQEARLDLVRNSPIALLAGLCAENADSSCRLLVFYQSEYTDTAHWRALSPPI